MCTTIVMYNCQAYNCQVIKYNYHVKTLFLKDSQNNATCVLS